MKRVSFPLISLATAIAWFGFVTGPFADPAEAAVTQTGAVEYDYINGSWKIGDYANGSLTIDNGSQQTTGKQATIGLSFWPTVTGTVTVTGPGSLWQLYFPYGMGGLGTLWVGYNGNAKGYLNIENGGRVNIAEKAVLGHQDNSQGTATVTGANSTWDVGDYLSVGDNSYGGSAKGWLTIANGGQVNSNSGYVGRYGAAKGTATVTGTNSIWDNAGTL